MEIIAVFASLIAFLIAGLFGKPLGDKGTQFITCTAVIISAVVSITLFFQININDGMVDNSYTNVLWQWISVKDFSVNWAIRIDSLSVVMLCIVNIVSACVHIYSVGYLKDDPAKTRFMAYLSLLTFTMLVLVTADNALQLFFGWEGVGFSSYLLIGFRNQKYSANAAAFKYFITNRVGDFSLILGIIVLYVVFGTLNFTLIFDVVEGYVDNFYHFMGFGVHALTLICLLLSVSAISKSAQIGLHVWLPDASESFPPASALLSAVTSVVAGVFLVVRFSPIFEYAPFALIVITIVGATTAIIATTIALVENDIKRVISYLAMSQIGYMFFALGVSAYGAAMLHLVAYAFFTSLLFLGAGSVIKVLSGEQDIRNMGGLYDKLPVTYVLMLIGSISLVGIWPFAGFYSKKIILEAAYSDHSWFGNYAYFSGVAIVFMTVFCIWRLMFMTFHGASGTSSCILEHERGLSVSLPISMKAPLMLLSAGAILSGGIFYGAFVGSPELTEPTKQAAIQSQENLSKEDIQRALREAVDESQKSGDKKKYINMWSRPYFWHGSIYVRANNDSIEAARYVPFWVKYLHLFMGLLGIAFAYLLYVARPDISVLLRKRGKALCVLLENKWFFDTVYSVVFVRGALYLGRLFFRTDKKCIDAVGSDRFADCTNRLAVNLSSFQNGHISRYAFVIVFSLICLVTWFVLKADPSFYMP